MDNLIEGIVWEVIKALCGCAQQEAAHIYNLEDNIKSLNEKWDDLLNMKQDLESRVVAAEIPGEVERTQSVKAWLKRVDDIQKVIENLQVEGFQELQNYCLCKCCPKNCVSRFKLGKNVVETRDKVDKLANRGEQYSNPEVPITCKREGKSIKIVSHDTVGLDSMVDKVWTSIEAENVEVVGIYGMGGVGKTTLLKTIHNKLIKEMPDFSIVMFVTVTKEPNLDSFMSDIQNDIRKSLGVGDNIWNSCSNREDKAEKIHKLLRKKRFVLLLDDVWERLDLELVGVPQPKDTGFQSKVIFTTRLEDVCAKMKAQRKFKLDVLTEEEAFKLFCLKVGEETLQSDPGIRDLARDMAAKCKGLPLALSVVGNAMAGENMKVWKYTNSNFMNSKWTALDLEKHVFSNLKFSYDRLPDEIHQNCLLYCALYPEDHEISVPDLIDKWICEGFLGNDMTKSIHDICDYGESVIEKLKLSCLLERIEDDPLAIKMHSMVREMALWLARDKNKNREKILVQGDVVHQDDVETWNTVERMSIIRHGELYLPTAPCPNLITLMLASTSSAKKIVDLSNILSMSRLKVLDLSFCKDTIVELPAEIGILLVLEYLSLTGNMRPSTFPTWLEKLKKLKFFSLTNLYLGDLACIPFQVIPCLEKLRILRFTSNSNKKSGEEMEFLEKLESLPNLEELWIQIKTDNGLTKLLASTKLQTRLWKLHLEDMDTLIHMPSLLAAMSMMRNLQQICFSNLKNVQDSSVFNKCCLNMLQTVIISKCHSIAHLTWLKYAPLLKDLVIDDCMLMDEVIKGGTEDEKGKRKVDSVFPSLRKLHFRKLPKLDIIHNTDLSFPSLRIIEIFGCPNLKKLPFDSSIFNKGCLNMLRTVKISKCHSITHLTWLKYAPLLKNIDIDDCMSMEEVIKGGIEDDNGKQKVHCVFPSLQELHLWNLPNLKSIQNTALPFPSLRIIEIFGCPNLKNLPFDSSFFNKCCLNMLRTVKISKCHSIAHLTWLKYAPLLQDLDINDCMSMEEVIKGGMEDEKGKEKVEDVFPSLQELHLWNLPNLKSIHKTPLSFPSLKIIEIFECPNLKKLPFDSCFAVDKLRLIKGDQKWWENSEWEDPTMKDTFLSKLQD